MKNTNLKWRKLDYHLVMLFISVVIAMGIAACIVFVVFEILFG